MLRRPFVPLVVIVVVLAAVTYGLTRGGGSPSLPGGATATSGSGWAGQLLIPQRVAPATTLRDYTGKQVSLAQFRGRAVLVTFLYTHCVDVCPVIASSLGNAVRQLGPEASKVQLLAISVDPRNDTPASIGRFLAERGLTGRMEYLVGNAAQLGPVWQAWNVGAPRDSVNPALVAHSALVYGVSASGKLVTIYQPDFSTAQILHDVPRLASM